MTVYFDMDGTIADLYGVDGWLDMLKREAATPYKIAGQLCDCKELGQLLCQLQKKGHKIGIISWLSKQATKSYKAAVRQAKKQWLRENIDCIFDEVHIIKYGTPKYKVAKDKEGILFDDETQNREQWKGTAYDETKIFSVLEQLV